MSPGIFQLAMLPSWSTSKAPNTVISTCPPLIIANERSISNVDAPANKVIGAPAEFENVWI